MLCWKAEVLECWTLLLGGGHRAEEVRSTGAQVGEGPPTFHPHGITGASTFTSSPGGKWQRL